MDTLLAFLALFCFLTLAKGQHFTLCRITDTSCLISDLVLDNKVFAFTPLANNYPAPSVKTIRFQSSKVPIVTNSACNSFPNIQNYEGQGIAIQEIREDAFLNCLDLRELRLHDNLIETLPSNLFLRNSKLNYLDLGNNMLTTIDPLLLTPIDLTNFFSVSGNRLTAFPPALMEHLPHLKELHLHSNSILDYDTDAFLRLMPALETISLGDNVISCTRLEVIRTALQKVYKNVLINGTNGKVRDFEMKPGLMCLSDTNWKVHRMIYDFPNLEVKFVETTNKMKLLEERVILLTNELDSLRTPRGRSSQNLDRGFRRK